MQWVHQPQTLVLQGPAHARREKMHELQLSTTHRWRSSALRKLHEIVTKCKHQGDYGLTERHYHTPSKPKDVFDDCLGRVRYGRRHGVSIPCDRQLPCRNCLTSTGEKSCRDQVECQTHLLFDETGSQKRKDPGWKLSRGDA